MVVDYSLGGMIPEIKEKMKTEHFILSEAILDIRFEKKLTFDEATEILDIPRETLQEYNSNEAITSNGGDIEDNLATETTDIFTDLVPGPNKKQHSYESSFNSQGED